MAILNAILSPLSDLFNLIYTASQVLFSKINSDLQQSQNHPPGPSKLDDDEKEAQQKSANLLEYLSFGAPRLMQRYGGIIRLGEKKYFIADKEAFKYILKTNVDNFTKRNKAYDRIKLIFGQGLIVNEGPQWKQHRQLLHPVFDRARLQIYSKIMTQHTTKLIEQWQQVLSSKKQKKFSSHEINIAKEMGIFTLKIAFSTFSHYEATEKELETVIRVFNRGNPHVSYFPILKPWFPGPQNLLFFHSLRKVNHLLERIIYNRKKLLLLKNKDNTTENYNDVLDILLTAKEKHNITLNRTEILDEYKTLLITGHETIGRGLAWACYLLAKHPEYRELIEAELNSTLNGRVPTLEDCQNLPFTKAVFLETLRLFPSIWILPRVAIEKDKICGYEIPSGSHILLNLYALHRNPEYWEDPETFNPTRFLGDFETKRDPFSYLPFSFGPHSCIGSSFGTMEAILVLATLWQRLRFEVVGKKEYKPEPYVSLRPPESLKMRVIFK